MGLLIGAARARTGRFNEGLRGGVTPTVSSNQRERGRNLREEGDDMRGPHVGVQKRGRGYRFGVGCCWAVGSFLLWAETFPRVHFHIFPFFASFSFLFFLFLS
jgi:hypothetical protein